LVVLYPQNKSKASSNNKGTQGPGPGAKSHQQKLTDLKGLDVTNNKILEKLNTASVTEDSCSLDSVIVAVFTDILFGCSLSDIIDHKHNLT
jgi:hypothetical protein